MNAARLNDLILAQFAAESYLNEIDLKDPQAVGVRLTAGNNNIQHPYVAQLDSADYPGYTRMSRAQIERFEQTYDVIRHQPDTWSGFSGTLLWNRISKDYVLSFRSTEYADDEKGGDWSRDGLGADVDIAKDGFALAQIADAEAWFRQLIASGDLPDGAKYRVTGYSLGGHIATVFAEAHAQENNFLGAVTFNSPGRGSISTNKDVRSLVDDTYVAMYVEDAVLRPASAGSVYQQNLYRGLDGVLARISVDYGTVGLAFTPNNGDPELAK